MCILMGKILAVFFTPNKMQNSTFFLRKRVLSVVCYEIEVYVVTNGSTMSTRLEKRQTIETFAKFLFFTQF